jgi:ribosome assembly protein YihI (activator of Der GTPase)
MGEMKNAWEKAMEKVEKLGKLSEEELKQLEYQPAGNKLAAKYLQEMDYNLDAEMTKYKGTGVRKYILQGAQEIFLRSIVLPKNEYDMQTTRRAMAGLRLLKENKKLLDTVLDRITNLLNYYGQARQQTYLQFKKDFEAKLREPNQTMQQQVGAKVRIEPEQHPQFMEEWRRINSQLDAQYEKALDEHKQQILKMT